MQKAETCHYKLGNEGIRTSELTENEETNRVQEGAHARKHSEPGREILSREVVRDP